MLPFQTAIKRPHKHESPVLVITDTTIGPKRSTAKTSVVLTRGDLHQISLALHAKRSVEVSPAPGLNRTDIRTWEEDEPAFWVVDPEHGTSSVHKSVGTLARSFREYAMRLAEIELGYDFALTDGGRIALEATSDGQVFLACTPDYGGESTDVELTCTEARELADALYALVHHANQPFD